VSEENFKEMGFPKRLIDKIFESLVEVSNSMQDVNSELINHGPACEKIVFGEENNMVPYSLLTVESEKPEVPTEYAKYLLDDNTSVKNE